MRSPAVKFREEVIRRKKLRKEHEKRSKQPSTHAEPTQDEIDEIIYGEEPEDLTNESETASNQSETLWNRSSLQAPRQMPDMTSQSANMRTHMSHIHDQTAHFDSRMTPISIPDPSNGVGATRTVMVTPDQMNLFLDIINNTPLNRSNSALPSTPRIVVTPANLPSARSSENISTSSLNIAHAPADPAQNTLPILQGLTTLLFDPKLDPFEGADGEDEKHIRLGTPQFSEPTSEDATENDTTRKKRGLGQVMRPM